MTNCKKAKTLDEVIKKSVIKSPTRVYHGMGKSEIALFKDKGIGSTFSNASFLSTSTREDVANNFTDHSSDLRRIMVIDLPAGSHGFAYGDGEYEAEVLLPRGSNFTITKIVKEPGYEYIHVTPS